MLNWQLVRIDKANGEETLSTDIRKDVERIAGHHGMAVGDVYEVLHNDRRIETDFSVYEYRVV